MIFFLICYELRSDVILGGIVDHYYLYFSFKGTELQSVHLKQLTDENAQFHMVKVKDKKSKSFTVDKTAIIYNRISPLTM